MSPRIFGRSVMLFLAAAVPAMRVHAQNLLYAERNGKMLLVRKAHGLRAMVEDGGKLVPSFSGRYAFRPADEYLPVFVSIRDIGVRVGYVQVADTAAQLNNEFEFRGELESPYRLDDVFVVLELDVRGSGKLLFLSEVGRLDPRQSRRLNLVVPLSGPLGEGQYQVHLFVGPHEVFHSLQPFGYREAALDRMVGQRIEGRADGPPELLVGPAPAYPPALLKAKRSGRVLVKFTLRRNGAVADPTIAESSDPTFDEPTLDAVRQWRFLPLIKDGHPTETTVRLPVAFEPPAAGTTKRR